MNNNWCFAIIRNVLSRKELTGGVEHGISEDFVTTNRNRKFALVAMAEQYCFHCLQHKETWRILTDSFGLEFFA